MKATKKRSDYLNLYIGQEYMLKNDISGHKAILRSAFVDSFPTVINLLLRPISDMNSMEMSHIYNLTVGSSKKHKIFFKKKQSEKGEFRYWDIKSTTNVKSITIDQLGDVDTYSEDNDNDCVPTSNQPLIFLYLIKQGFDLFGLIDEGIAIDRTKNLKP